mgnify:CR=1 FL=1
MRGQRKNPRKAVQPFENKKRKIDIFKNYEANGVEKIQRKLEIFSTLISKKSKGGRDMKKVLRKMIEICACRMVRNRLMAEAMKKSR